MQFAYKRYQSTNMCTTMIKEKASYYNKHTYVFMCTLDAPKAFDRVHLGKLFALLYNWGLPHVANRLLLDMCTHAPTHVYHMEWGQIAVLCFRKWCKARRILSPILFCVYIDELLNRLLSSGIGCHMGNLSHACFGYADDVNLLAPSVGALHDLIKKLRKICQRISCLIQWKKGFVCVSGGMVRHRVDFS